MRIAAALAVLLALATPAAAQTSPTMGSMPDMNAYQRETMAAMETMNKAMQQGMIDPDPGMAWMKSMAAHHQGAIDMSKIVLKHTKDAEVTREARKTAQENEMNLKELQSKLKK